MRFTTLQKMSATMLRRHGERLVTTVPASRGEGVETGASEAAGRVACWLVVTTRARDFLRGWGGFTAPRRGGRTVPDVRHARPRVDPPSARGVECRRPAPRGARSRNLGRDDDDDSTVRSSLPLADGVNSARAALCGARRRETPRIATMTFPGFDEDLLRSPPRASTPPRFVASPHASASADARDESTCRFDAAFNRVVFEIQRRLHLVARGPKIRVQFWLRKLHEHVRPRTFAPLYPRRARRRRRRRQRQRQRGIETNRTRTRTRNDRRVLSPRTAPTYPRRSPTPHGRKIATTTRVFCSRT